MYRFLAVIASLALSDTLPLRPTPAVHCLAGPRAETFLGGVQHLLSATDSTTVAWRAVIDLPTMRRADVALVTDEAVCAQAAREYAKHAGPGRKHQLPFAVAVAAAPGVYVVELGLTAGTDAEYWEVVIFSREWKRIWSHGGGS